MARLDHPRIGIERADDRARSLDLLGAATSHLLSTITSANSICSTSNCTSGRSSHPGNFAAIAKKIRRRIIAHEVRGIDDRHHGVEPSHVRKTVAVLVAEFERRRNRQRFGNPSALDQEIVEALFRSEPAHLFQRSSRSVQQMHPFDISTSASSVRERFAPPFSTSSASMLTSHHVVTMTATLRPSRFVTHG